jgi:Gamma tubulin complex component C-terminal/Gamma tubulin complex component N-terminal
VLDSNKGLPDIFQGPQSDECFFALPELSFDNPGDLLTPHESHESAGLEGPVEQGPPTVEEEQLSNIWTLLGDGPLEEAKYLSWDSFEEQDYKEPHTGYITEAGPQVFDAALADVSDLFNIENVDNIIIETRVYAASLLALGLGRSSVLFSWNEDNISFEPQLIPMRISGCTKEMSDKVLATFMTCGNTTRALQLFVEQTYVKHKSPSWISLGDVVSTILTTLQSRLNVSASSLTSILQLQSLFRPAEALLICFELIVKSVASAESDEAMLSQLFEEIQRLEHRASFMRNILLEVLARVSRPFLDFAGAWVGLEKETGMPLEKSSKGKSFVKVEDIRWVGEIELEKQEPDFVFDTTFVPSFFPVDDARNMFETGKSLRFLRTHHPGHALAKADVVSSANPPKLEWVFSWQGIEEVQARALKYEMDLKIAIEEYSEYDSNPGSPHITPMGNSVNIYKLDVFGRLKEEIEAHMLASIEIFNQSPCNVPTTDKLSSLLTQSLAGGGECSHDSTTLFAPPICLTPFLSFNPVIAAQARVVNSISIRLFFQKHNLREHLLIQRRFQLLGDGLFSSRLSHALFDPELESAKREAGVARSGGIVGLRLGGRDNWPPASSELRLALMGVLTESYVSTTLGGREHVGGYLDLQNELPGDLSFAVRDMSDEEIEKCIDPNSIEALDFLRISYKPPPPLEAVITPLSLYKYDQLFRLLLRVTRMLYVVTKLVRDATDRFSYWQGSDKTAQRFRAESHHFVSCLSEYFFDIGIDATWKIFERMLDRVTRWVNSGDNYATLGQHESIDKLREYHERVLDRIMFTLLLRKRQQSVMQLLEDIFTLILQFSEYSRPRALGISRKSGQDQDVRGLYLKFRRKVEVFITVCKGLSEKKGYGEKRILESQGMESGGLFDFRELTEENTIAHLLARLEMSDYYSRVIV